MRENERESPPTIVHREAVLPLLDQYLLSKKVSGPDSCETAQRAKAAFQDGGELRLGVEVLVQVLGGVRGGSDIRGLV